MVDERKGYLNTDELQADDEISPQPSDGESGSRRVDSPDTRDDGANDTARVPRAATSQ